MIDIGDAIKIALEVGTAAVAIGGWVHRKLIMPATAWREGIDGKFDDILHELKTNGGNSLRDEVRAIRTKVETSAARFLAFGGEATMGCFISDPEGSCTWVNRAYLRISERTEGEVLGWGWTNIIHPDDRGRVRQEWDQAIEEEREFHSAHRYLRPDGTDITVYVHSRPVRDGAGKLIEHIGFVRSSDDSCALRGECLPPTRGK